MTLEESASEGLGDIIIDILGDFVTVAVLITTVVVLAYGLKVRILGF
jgi:hypothetical protein